MKNNGRKTPYDNQNYHEEIELHHGISKNGTRINRRPENRGYYPLREDPHWIARKLHRFPLQRQGCRPWVRILLRPQVARPGHEGYRNLDENFQRQQVRIDDMQFGLMRGWSTINTICIVRQSQEKLNGVIKTLYMAFVDLENAIDRVSRRVIC